MGRFTWSSVAWGGGVLVAVLAAVHGWALLATAERTAGESLRGAQSGPEGAAQQGASQQRVRICPVAAQEHIVEWYALGDQCPSAGGAVRATRLGVVLGAAHAAAGKRTHGKENCPGADETGDAVGHAYFAANAGVQAADRSLAEALSAVEELHRERGSALRGTLLDAAELEGEFNVILSRVPAGKLFRARSAGPAACVEGCLTNQRCSDYAPAPIALPLPPDAESCELVESLRRSSRLLDLRSHALEGGGLYDEADRARAMAEHLRLEARVLCGSGSETGAATFCPMQGYGPVQDCPAQGYCPTQSNCPQSFCPTQSACPTQGIRAGSGDCGVSLDVTLPAAWLKALTGCECDAACEAVSTAIARGLKSRQHQAEVEIEIQPFNFFQGLQR